MALETILKRSGLKRIERKACKGVSELGRGSRWPATKLNNKCKGKKLWSELGAEKGVG